MRRAAVFIDWQNCYHGARLAFHNDSDPARYGNVGARALAQLLVEKAASDAQLTFIGIYRGEPSPRKDPKTHGAFMRQRQAWEVDCGPDLVRIRTRAVRYLAGRPLSEADEKGVDVQLAIDAMVMGVKNEYDMAILATADTDLLPVAEGIVALKELTGKPEVAVIGWAGTSQHLELAQVPVLWIGKNDYAAIRDHTDYNIPVADRWRKP